MEKEINGKVYKVRELTYLEALDLEGLSNKEVAKKMLHLSTGISEEELSKLSLKDGLELQKTVNEVNNFQSFQEPNEKD